MTKSHLGIFKNKNLLNKGQILFLVGIFLLPSTLIFGVIFLIPSAIIGFMENKRNYFKDKWNIYFFSCGLLMLSSAILQKFILRNDYSNIWDENLSLLGLANWIPLIWLFWSVQPYLHLNEQRKNAILALVSGTLPILFSGFVQYFLNWTGPFSLFNGLIIWYQKPIVYPGGLSSVFSHQNYAGSWLNFIWPFCIALVLDKSQNFLKRSISINFLFSVGLAIFLTNSRNAWSGLLISLPVVIGVECFYWLIPFLLILITLVIITVSDYFSGDLQNYFRLLIPEQAWMEFTKEGFKDLDVSRIEILKSAIKLILTKPIFGYGSASFSVIYFTQTTFWKGHSHNLLAELALSYGLPATIIFFATVNSILIISAKKIFFLQNKGINAKDFYERAWWCSTFFFLISQMADVQYFDGKISIVFWILLAGLKNSIVSKNNKKFI